MPPKAGKPPEKPRFDWPWKRCKYCKVRFKPRPDHHGRTQECCTPDHRKLYHKHGGLQFDKLIARVMKDKAVRALVLRIEVLEQWQQSATTEIINLHSRIVSPSIDRRGIADLRIEQEKLQQQRGEVNA